MTRMIFVALLFTLLIGTTASAAELTPVGAERAGNADGSIPAWTGGLAGPPAWFNPEEHEADPYPEDQPIATITAANVDQYAEQLSEGQRELFKRFPQSWKMPVYETRRSAAYPDWVYDALQRNDDIARRVPDTRSAVQQARVTSPFPRPRNGEEVVWNHVLRWRGIHIIRDEGTAAVTRAGKYRLVWSIQDLAIPYALPWDTPRGKFDNILFAAKVKWLQPSQLTGAGVLVHETMNQGNDPRKIWRYLTEARQVIRQPTVGYDLPASYVDGLRTQDDFELFLAPPDAFEWTLLGKRELYIPYNAYRVHADSARVEDIVGPRHLEPSLLRYELHRVWVVEGRLRDGERHVYGRRVFYVDEDSWQIAIADNYDLDGKLVRLGEAHAVNFYTLPVLSATLYSRYDFPTGRYLVEGLDNQRRPARFLPKMDALDFTPNSLNYYVR